VMRGSSGDGEEAVVWNLWNSLIVLECNNKVVRYLLGLKIVVLHT